MKNKTIKYLQVFFSHDEDSNPPEFLKITPQNYKLAMTRGVYVAIITRKIKYAKRDSRHYTSGKKNYLATAKRVIKHYNPEMACDRPKNDSL